MTKDTSIQVIYIAGNGHSGSTLLDMVLGSNEGCFSTGELSFIIRDSILEEYCSCNKKISECEVWSEVFKLWEENREITYQKYRELSLRYQRNKSVFRTLINYISPSADFKKFGIATLNLFQAIQKVTGCSIIIDSSKSPQRIAVLSKVVDLKVLHICRDFTGVLNSGKGSVEKNIEAGIEEEIKPRRTWKVVLDWIFTNFTVELFSIGNKSKKVFYKKFVNRPEILNNIDPSFKQYYKEQSFSASHMLAGNVIRLKKNLKINQNIGFRYRKLSKIEYIFGKVIDRLFFFWS